MAYENQTSTSGRQWTFFEKTGVRGILIFIILAVVPHHADFYKSQWKYYQTQEYKWRIIDRLTHYKGWFFDNDHNDNYLGYLFTLAVCIALGALWEKFDRKDRNFDTFYYWTETVVRYVLMYRMSFYGITKLFPVQMPFPTISQLNINLGDFAPGKLYWLTTGAAPGFEIFSGVFELVATLLLLWRRTVTLGALLLVAILVPIWVVNITYDAGVELTAFDYLLLASLLLVKDACGIWNFLVLRKPAVPADIPPPALSSPFIGPIRIGAKVLFVSVIFVFMGYQYSIILKEGKSFKLPREKGWPGTEGFYDVSEFYLNNKKVPYAPDHEKRWQDVVFEKHRTISIKIARPILLDKKNKNRTEEFFGNTGRIFYEFHVDSLNHILSLINRADTSEKLRFAYDRPEPGAFVLEGVNEQQDSVRVVLKRIEKRYPLKREEGIFIPR